MKQSIIEAHAYECLAQTNPALQSSWDGCTIQALLETRNSIIRNKHLYDAFNIKLEIIDIYMKSYQRTFEMIGSKVEYTNLKSTGLQAEFEEASNKYTKLMKKAKTSIIDLAIKEEEIYYLDVLAVIKNRYRRYKREYEADKSNRIKESYYLTYGNMIEKAEQVIKTQKFTTSLMVN